MSEEVIQMPPEEEVSPMSIVEVWISAITKPREETFAQIAAQPNATTGNALVWVFVSSLVVNMFTAIVQAFSLRSVFADPMVSEYMPEVLGSFGIGTLICWVPLSAIFGVISFAIFAGLIQWVAGMFGGAGNFEKMAYAMMSITVPVSVILAILSLFTLIPYVGVLIGFGSLAVIIYALVLEVMAAKGVNQFDWGKAIGSVFLPGLVIVLIVCCCLVAASAIIGTQIGEIFNEINQGLY